MQIWHFLPLSKLRHRSSTVTQGARSILKIARVIRSDFTKKRQENTFARSTGRCGPTGRTLTLSCCTKQRKKCSRARPGEAKKFSFSPSISPGQLGGQTKKTTHAPDRADLIPCRKFLITVARPGGFRPVDRAVSRDAFFRDF